MSDYKYERATGALTAMTRFLLEDLNQAMSMIPDLDQYQAERFGITINQAKRVLADVDAETRVAAA